MFRNLPSANLIALPAQSKFGLTHYIRDNVFGTHREELARDQSALIPAFLMIVPQCT